LHCRHCWITPTFVDGKPSPGDCLDLQVLRDAVAEAKRLGLSSAKLTGGEPTLHPDFVKVADLLSEEKVALSMETNGTLIDRDLAIHLRKNTTMGHVAVSLDSPVAEQHDRFRGLHGAFAAAVRGIENLVAAEFRPQVIMSVCHENLDQVEPLIELALRLGAGSVKFNPVTPSGRGIELHRQGLGLTCDETLQLTRRIRGPLQEAHQISLNIMIPPALATARELLRGACDGGSCHVRNILGILGTGEMALCGIGRNIPELCFGFLGRDRIRTVWTEHPTLLKLRHDLDARPYPGICGDCIHAPRCQTLCVAQNYQATGHLVDVPTLCAEIEQRGLFPASRRRSAPSPSA
jgi:SynChlorMet cassette radical SAM/SPASM protein ScmF